MVHVIKGYVFNTKANQLRNRHVFHMSRANLGVTLKNMNEVDPGIKFDLINNLDQVLIHDDIDCDSFNKLLYDRLILMKNRMVEYPKLGSVVDALVKHFNLWSPQ